MIKNRISQIVFQTVYLAIGFIAIIGSLGYFNRIFEPYFYLWFTNLSNYICYGFMIACFVFTIRNSKQNGYICLSPKFNFMNLIMITITCLVYNFLLTKGISAKEYFFNITSLTLHLILSVMYMLHWVLFYEHGNARWFYPLLSAIMPLIYVAFVLIRAVILKGKTGVMLWPYFFLDLDNLGWEKFTIWLLGLCAVFIALGYIVYFLDKIGKHKHYLDKNNSSEPMS